MSKAQRKNTPELRFSQFNGEWVQKSLSDFMISYNGGAPLKPSDFVNESDYEVIPKKAIIRGGKLNLDQNNPTYCSKDFFLNHQTSIVDKSYLITTLRDLVPTGPSIGLIVKNDNQNDLLLAQGVYGFQLTDLLDSTFLTSWSNKEATRRKMFKLAVGSTQIHIRTGDFFNIGLFVPSLPEQQKIAAALQSVDDKLTQLRHKQQLLQTYKRGIMQKIFTQQLRFKQDNGRPFPDWETKRVSDIMAESRIKGSTGDKAKKITVKLWGKGVYKKEDRIQGSVNTQYYIRKAGQFIYSKLDFLNCAFGVIPHHLDTFQTTVDLPCFDIEPEVNKLFILELIKQRSFYIQLGNTADGSRKAKRIHADAFLGFPITLPHPNEQQKIADFLTAIDIKIDAVAQQITQIETFKKGLLQKMFV